jgi:hypothetical protein
MTDTVTYRPLLSQHGIIRPGPFTYVAYEEDIGSQEGEQSYPFVLGSYFQMYDFELNFDSERGLPLDAPNFFTRAAGGLYFTLTLETTETSAPTDWALYWINEEAPDAWVEGQTAPTLTNSNRVLIAENISSTYWSLNSNGSTWDLAYPVDFNTVTGTRPPISVQNTTRSTRWNGLLQFQFSSAAGATVIVRDPEAYNRGFLQGQYVYHYTGWENRPAERGRPVPDMRTGMPSFAEDLIEDDYTPGIWTSAKQWDPDDPRDVRPVEFPADEGVKKDDVPV